jgi:hypothetical protein
MTGDAIINQAAQNSGQLKLVGNACRIASRP